MSGTQQDKSPPTSLNSLHPESVKLLLVFGLTVLSTVFIQSTVLLDHTYGNDGLIAINITYVLFLICSLSPFPAWFNERFSPHTSIAIFAFVYSLWALVGALEGPRLLLWATSAIIGIGAGIFWTAIGSYATLQSRIFNINPGITGAWQTLAFRLSAALALILPFVLPDISWGSLCLMIFLTGIAATAIALSMQKLTPPSEHRSTLTDKHRSTRTDKHRSTRTDKHRSTHTGSNTFTVKPASFSYITRRSLNLSRFKGSRTLHCVASSMFANFAIMSAVSIIGAREIYDYGLGYMGIALIACYFATAIVLSDYYGRQCDQKGKGPLSVVCLGYRLSLAGTVLMFAALQLPLNLFSIGLIMLAIILLGVAGTALQTGSTCLQIQCSQDSPHLYQINQTFLLHRSLGTALIVFIGLFLPQGWIFPLCCVLILGCWYLLRTLPVRSDDPKSILIKRQIAWQILRLKPHRYPQTETIQG